jgi:hypothetical protein
LFETIWNGLNVFGRLGFKRFGIGMVCSMLDWCGLKWLGIQMV